MKNQTPTNKKKKPITAHRGATAIHESPRREPSVTPRQRDVGIGMGADPNTQQPKLKNPTRAKLQDREKMFDAQQAQHKAMFKKGKQWSDPKARRQFNLSQRQEREMFNLHRTTGGKNPRAMFDLSKRHQRRSFKRFGNPADREKFFTGLKSQTQQFNAAELAKQRMNEQARGNARRNLLIAEGEATRAGNKGMAVTKKAVGHNDFRKGGLTLSVVNNLKK